MEVIGIERHSYYLGQFVGMNHLMENLLQYEKLELSYAQRNLTRFCDDPTGMFLIFKEMNQIMGEKLLVMGRKTWLAELQQVSLGIDEQKVIIQNFEKSDFLNGFHQQLAWGRVVRRR